MFKINVFLDQNETNRLCKTLRAAYTYIYIRCAGEFLLCAVAEKRKPARLFP